MNNIIIPRAFKLEFKINSVTKQNIIIPFKILSKDKLILCPIFCDFYDYLETLNNKGSTDYQISQIDADEYYIILLLWNLREILNKINKNYASVDIILYPQQHSFGICKIEENIERYCFHSYSQFQRRCNQISEALKSKRIRELQLNLFEIYQSDRYIQNSDNIEKNSRQNLIMRQQIDQNLINEIEIKYGIKNKNNFLIRYGNLINFQSTLCLTGEIENDLNHKIQFNDQSNPKCACGLEIDPYNCDTLIIDYQLKEAVDQLVVELLMDLNLDYTVFLIPLFLEIEMDEYQNEWIILFYKDKNQRKIKLKKLIFKAKIYYENIDEKEDIEVNKKGLFDGTDTFDIQEIDQTGNSKLSNEYDIQSFWKQDLDHY